MQCIVPSRKSSNMDSFLLFLVVAIGALASPLQAAEIGSPNCAQKYQEVMKEAVSIKEECDGAGFYDCCQVCFLTVQFIACL